MFDAQAPWAGEPVIRKVLKRKPPFFTSNNAVPDEIAVISTWKPRTTLFSHLLRFSLLLFSCLSESCVLLVLPHGRYPLEVPVTDTIVLSSYLISDQSSFGAPAAESPGSRAHPSVSLLCPYCHDY